MRRTCLAVSILSTSIVVAPLSAQPTQAEVAARPETSHLKPSSPWNLDFGETKCRLQRVFEKDGKRHALIIEQSAPGQGFGLILAGPELSRLKGAKELGVGLGADVPIDLKERILPGTLPDYGSAFIMGSVTIPPPKGDASTGPTLRSAGIDLARAATVNRIVLATAKGAPAIAFETGNMKEAFAALNTCTDDLLAQWGLDPQQHRAFRPPMLANGVELATHLQRNYPVAAARKGESGVFGFRLIVEPDGKVSSCHVEASTRVTELDPRCDAIVRIARLEPARDAQGQPMRSFYFSRLTYLIP